MRWLLLLRLLGTTPGQIAMACLVKSFLRKQVQQRRQSVEPEGSAELDALEPPFRRPLLMDWWQKEMEEAGDEVHGGGTARSMLK